jgi:hypothetical protein
LAVYYGVLTVLALGAGILCWSGLSRWKSILFGFAALLLLGGLAAFRYAVGYDYTHIYVPLYFQTLRDDLSILGSVHEPGFMLLEKLLLFFTPNYQALFIATSFLIYGLTFYYYWKFSPNICLSILIFLLLGQYYSSMNFVRQSMAVAITLFAVPFLQKRRLAAYLLIILLAALFHKSALIMIPFYFINLIPVSWYTLPVYTLVTAVAYLLSGKVVAFVTRFWYSGYGEPDGEVISAFPFPFTISMAIAFALLFGGYKRLRSLNRSYYIYVNYAFFALFFVLMGTRIAILDRFSSYFDAILPVALPLLIQEPEDSKAAEDASPALLPHTRLSLRSSILLGGILIWGAAFHQYVLMKDNHAVVPYRCIFNQPVYQEYTEGLKDDPIGAWEKLLIHWAAGEIDILPEQLLAVPEDPA